MSKKVDKNVGKSKRKQPKYKKGKYPYTVLHIDSNTLYVRKSVTINKTITDEKTGESKFVKQRQIWRICEPQTAARAEELVKEIESDIYFTKTGRARPLSNFSDVADAFARVELTEAVYENGKKIAGRRSLEYPRLVVAMLKEYFGNYDISEITYGAIETFKAERIRTPIITKYKSRPRSIRTVHYELGFLRQIFNFAYRRRWLDRSPFADGKNLIRTSDETRRHITWTREEESRALALCNHWQYRHMKPVIICITDGGFRRGELLRLKWSEVDYERGVLPARSYKGKNLHTRDVYMTDRMRAALIEWKKFQKKRNKIKDKTLVIGFADIKHAWETISEKIGRTDIKLHDLRHIFATRLHLEAKAQISVISKALGHSSTRTTEIYINARKDDVAVEIEKLNKLNSEFEQQEKEKREKAKQNAK